MYAGGHAQENWYPPSRFCHIFNRRPKPDMRPSVRRPVRWQHFEDVLRSLGQDEPVQIAALADHGQSFSSPLIGHLVVPEITERHTENSTPFAGRCRLTNPSGMGHGG